MSKVKCEKWDAVLECSAVLGFTVLIYVLEAARNGLSSNMVEYAKTLT